MGDIDEDQFTIQMNEATCLVDSFDPIIVGPMIWDKAWLQANAWAYESYYQQPQPFAKGGADDDEEQFNHDETKENSQGI